MTPEEASSRDKIKPALITFLKTFLEIVEKATIAEKEFLEDMSEEIGKHNLKSFKSFYDESVLQEKIAILMKEMINFAKVQKSNKDDKIHSMKKQIEKTFSPEMILFVYFVLVCIVSAMVHKKPIRVLYEEAKGGNLDSLYKLIQLDKTIIEHEWFQDLVMRAMIKDDIQFFRKIGNAIKTDPPIGRLKHNKLKMALFLFWPLGLEKITNPELVEFLEQCGFTLHEDIESFRKRIRSPVQKFYKQYSSIL